MPLGESNASKFFTPVHQKYAVRLLGIRDGKSQTYPATAAQAARTAIPAIWSFALYFQDGQPVLDPANPAQIPAIAEAMSGQSTGFGKDGQPAKGRVWLTPFAEALGIPFPDEASLDEVQAIVRAVTGAWAWFTWGPNPDHSSKTTTIVRAVKAMIPQPAPSPLPQIVAAPARAAVAPVSFAPASALPAGYVAPAPSLFAATPFAAAPVAPAAPVFAAASVAVVSGQEVETVKEVAPVFGVATPPSGVAVDAIPAMVFPTS